MSVDIATVKRVARLARIALAQEEAEWMREAMAGVLHLAEQLDGVDVDGVEPMTSVIPTPLVRRKDTVCDGDKVADIVANAPMVEENFFLVPKVVE